jgi:ribose transport system substrate-binding protein
MGRRRFGRGDAGGPDRLNLDQPSLGGADVGTGKTGRKVACAAAVMTLLAVASGCGSDSSSESSSNQSEATPSGGSQAADLPSLDQLYKGTFQSPPTTSPPGAKGKSVYWITCTSATPACAVPAEAAKEAAKVLGVKLTVVDGKFNAGGAWSAAVRTALAGDADAIILHGIACPPIQQALQEAKQQGVVVLGPESNDCSDTGGPKLFTAEIKYFDKAQDAKDYWTEYGAHAAEYLIAKSGGKAKIINNGGTEPQQKFVDDGFLEEIKKCSGCEIVGTVPYSSPDLVPNGPWIQAFRTAVVKYPQATAVYFPFDLLAGSPLGGAEALKSAGRKVLAVAGGSTPYTLDLVRNGQATGIGSMRSADWIGWATMDAVNRALQNKPQVVEGNGWMAVDERAMACPRSPARRSTRRSTSRRSTRRPGRRARASTGDPVPTASPPLRHIPCPRNGAPRSPHTSTDNTERDKST